MKKLIILLVFAFLQIGCNNDNDSKPLDTNIVGTWQLVHVYSSDGGSNSGWNRVKNGYTYTFKDDGSFTSTRFKECTSGTYKLEASLLTLTFGCPNFGTKMTPNGTFIENYNIEDGKMILSPTYLSCIEGCGYRFMKIKN
ncbi:lipocalin family protein [Flavobacterium sp. LHD-80]|uniref:lipocalin family protein n=1 Tax=Flavobacterium sp. LHD-80 TaxID=3071411 RepID=UPI0027DF470F|nr:lipocalin family protein [Flavobacterium sp. LHD-80]MDQ6472375.1 lipocalin family protein [Flavobacterium sp. LHD-80]